MNPFPRCCARAPVNSFEFQPCGRTPQADCPESHKCNKTASCPTASIHRLRRGLPGYLILFDPHAIALECQIRASEPPSPPVFLPISTNFTSTLGIPLPSLVLEPNSFNGSSGVELRAFTTDLDGHLRALYAQ